MQTLTEPGEVAQMNDNEISQDSPKLRDKKQILKKILTVVFCIPGSIFSGRFLECWTNLLAWCLSHNIRPILSRAQSNNIYFVRNMVLGADTMRGPKQKPFNGQLQYDYLCWIDSDTLFTPQQFERLLSHDKDIVAGIYQMEGGQAFATVKDWDEEYFEKNGCFKFLTVEDLNKVQGSGFRVQEKAGSGMNSEKIISNVQHPTSKIQVIKMAAFTITPCILLPFLIHPSAFRHHPYWKLLILAWGLCW